MMNAGDPARIEIVGVNGERFVVSGPGMGEQGVELSKSPEGIHDEAPIKTIWQQSAFQEGATYVDYTIEPLDLVLAFDIVGEQDNWEDIESRFYGCFDPERPATIIITTAMESRTLKVTKLEHSKTTAERDPRILGWSKITFTLRAAWPFWEGRTVIKNVQINTAGTAYIEVSNPTDRPIWMQWAVTAPGRWTLPDFSFMGDANAARTVTTPTLASGQDLTIDTYPLRESYTAADGSNIAGRFGGIEFQFPVPPHTPQTLLPVKLEAGAASSGAQLRMVEYWQRPWGGRR